MAPSDFQIMTSHFSMSFFGMLFRSQSYPNHKATIYCQSRPQAYLHDHMAIHCRVPLPLFSVPWWIYHFFWGDTPALTAVEHQNSHTFGLPGGQTFFRFDLWYLHCGLLSFGPCYIGDNSFRIGRWEMLESDGLGGWLGPKILVKTSPTCW